MGVHPGKPEASALAPALPGRIASIDALRGLVMVLMLLDHLRETWFLHVPVDDPVDARTTLPAVALARLAVSLCAPIFVALTGVAAYHAAAAIWGPMQGSVFGVSNYGWVVVWYVGLVMPLYWPTAWSSRFKAARRNIAWLKYL